MDEIQRGSWDFPKVYQKQTLRPNSFPMKTSDMLGGFMITEEAWWHLLSQAELESCRREPGWEPAHKLLERIKKSSNEKIRSNKEKNRGK